MYIIKVSKKIKVIVSLIACTLAMLCSALPSLALADDSVNEHQDEAFAILEQTLIDNGITLSDYNYIYNWGYQNDYYDTFHIIGVPFTSMNFTNGVYSENFSATFYSEVKYDKESKCFQTSSFYNSMGYVGFNLWTPENPVLGYYHVTKTNVKMTNNGSDVEIKDPNAPVTPFTVSYTPSLSKNMSRKGTLTAPGASNDGQEIESNGLNVKVTLTDDFINLRNKYDELKDYTYEFICYITTSPPESTSYAESLENAVYTSLSYGKYMYTTSGVVEDVTDDTGEPTNWIKADGINAGNIISKGSTTKNVTINLENLDSSKFTDNTELYIVVYGRLTSMSTPTPDYFDLDNQGYICNKGSLNTKQIITVNADPETGEGIDVTMPDYYCVTSDVFSYKDYPEYKPKIFSNGSEIDTNKPLTDYLDKKLQPDYMYDYDMDKNGEKGLPPDEFAEYEKQKELDKTASSFSFDINGLNDIFAEGGHFFEFLTASISVLPGAFLTILLTFFGVMLAICLVKWLL